MHEQGSLLGYLRDPRLAPHATAALPVWLWSADASRVLWANAAGAAIFDAASVSALMARHFGLGHSAAAQVAAQVARLAPTLNQSPAPRLARLRDLGAGFGRPLTCACSRIVLNDGAAAILVAATEPAGPKLSLNERVQRLLADCDEPLAIFNAGGQFLGATGAAPPPLTDAADIANLEAGGLAAAALNDGQASGDTNLGRLSFVRIGSAASAMLVVSLTAAPSDHAEAAQKKDAAASAITPVGAALETIEPPPARKYPLRFVWQIDDSGKFRIDACEFVDIAGPRTAHALGQPWARAAAELGVDPHGEVARALASGNTWSGITVPWPVDGSPERLPVELSGLPVFDRDREVLGHRGFGICREVSAFAIVPDRRRQGLLGATDAPAQTAVEKPAEPALPDGNETALSKDISETATSPTLSEPARDSVGGATADPRDTEAAEKMKAPRQPFTVVPQSENVVPFRNVNPQSDAKPLALSPVERNAFGELARRLTARLKSPADEPPQAVTDPSDEDAPSATLALTGRDTPPPLSAGRPGAPDERPVLDRLPVGVLIYRLDRLIYGNRAFLDWTGYASIDDLSAAGGLDALFVDHATSKLGESVASHSFTVMTNRGDKLPVEGRLFAIPWNGESALLLMLTVDAGAAGERDKTAELALRKRDAEVRELNAILDVAADGVLVMDGDGGILGANRNAEALFGYEAGTLAGFDFSKLLAPESERIARADLDDIKNNGVARAPDGGREVVGQRRKGGLVSLSMKMARVGENEPKYCAVFRDLTQWKTSELDLIEARREAERASAAKSDFLAKISHEVRTPLNAIIGFSEVMMSARFGPVGNERYRAYIGDIHESGGHVVALLNDLLDLSKIEAGKLDLDFVTINLNEMTQQCVAMMQPQANRDRIIVRTSLSETTPEIVADARSVRQMLLNLLSNSVKFTAPGGQVIVSTARTERGEVALRVRDTGHGMSETDLEIALEPFRQLQTSSRGGSGGSGLGLPLTKALAEANHAKFAITSSVKEGTLVEIVFSGARMAAE